MNKYLVELVKMFADGTPLDALQLQGLLDNGLVREVVSDMPIRTGFRAFEFTQTGASLVKNG